MLKDDYILKLAHELGIHPDYDGRSLQFAREIERAVLAGVPLGFDESGLRGALPRITDIAGGVAHRECGERQEAALSADNADMVWPDDDTETFHRSIDDAVEYEVQQAWPTEGPLELKVQLAKRIPTAVIRIFNITENGHEWVIVRDEVQ